MDKLIFKFEKNEIILFLLFKSFWSGVFIATFCSFGFTFEAVFFVLWSQKFSSIQAFTITPTKLFSQTLGQHNGILSEKHNENIK